MRRVDRPVQRTRDTFDLCVRAIRDDELRDRLLGVIDHVEREADQYAVHASAANLHRVRETADVAGAVTTAEMVGVYSNRMAKKRSAGRAVYDALRLLPAKGICPFCDHGMVSTLDHILPKALFPVLAVTPDNLVGACGHCNHAKLDKAPTSAEDATLHPYFDDVGTAQWLTARVERGAVASVVFGVQDVATWAPELNARVANQFRELGLAEMYSSLAAREICGHRVVLERVHDSQGAQGVRRELGYKAESWQQWSRSCWQTVTFDALSSSDWYCEGGFRQR